MSYNPNWPAENLSTLQAWYTFDDPDYLFTDTDGITKVQNEGDRIARINDRSGAGRYLTQSTSTRRPWWRLDQMGGLAVAEFRPADSTSLFTASPGALLQNVAAATIVTVGIMGYSGAVSAAAVVSTGTSAGNPRAAVWWSVGTTFRVRMGGRSLDDDPTGLSLSPEYAYETGDHVIVAGRLLYSTKLQYLYLNNEHVGTGSVYTSANTSDTAPMDLSLGRIGTPGNYLAGYLAEVLICGSDLGTDGLASLTDSYLAPKWFPAGLTLVVSQPDGFIRLEWS